MSQGIAFEARFELEPRGCFVALAADGLVLGLRRRGLETRFVPFAELTHVETTRLGVWLATTRTTQVIRRSHFVDARDPDQLVQAVLSRLAERPGGPEQLARMREVAARALHPHRSIATHVLFATCLAIFALQWIEPLTVSVGLFYPGLFALGEYWRAVTANLLHSMSIIPLHLVINMLCLLAFGTLVERPLGWLRTFVIMGASGFAAMLASAAAGDSRVLGASGVVAGLVGAVLWLELQAPEELPAWWRVPRRIFIAAIVLQAVLDQLLPFIAAAAHLGGLAAGYLTASFVAPGAFEGRSPDRGLRVAAAAVGMCVALSLFSAGQLVLRDPGAMASHARHLMAWPRTSANALNAVAWRMVTESDPGPEELQVALEAAERAVAMTGHLDPNILDTLAEVRFVAGDEEGAVRAIDEAILLAGGEIYFREQRRRFTGERAADDRPDPPEQWIVPPTRVRIQDPGISI